MPLILEGIMTTTNEDGSPNISPMGPIVDASMKRLTLRPYETSSTYANLRRTGHGVFHVTDDVGLIAHAAVGTLDPLPETTSPVGVNGHILADACRWYAISIESIDDSQQRITIEANVIAEGRLRDFFGFNRAKHAVIEAAILATRVDFLPADEILADFKRLQILVDKTGGEPEHDAFDFLHAFVTDATKNKTSA